MLENEDDRIEADSDEESHSSSFDSSINPARGLSMVGAFDTNGNAYGSSYHDASNHSFSSSFDRPRPNVKVSRRTRSTSYKKSRMKSTVEVCTFT